MAQGYQCPKCNSDRVSIDYDFIRCLSCGLTEPLCDYRQADPYVEPKVTPAQLQSIEDRLQDVEELVATPGSVPRQFHDQLQQNQARTLFVEKKILEHIDKSKRKTKYI